MSKLDALIQKLCPNGVPYMAISECTRPIQNIKWKNEGGTRKYIDLTSVNRDTHKIEETTVVDKENAPSRAQQIVHSDDILFGSTRPMLKRFCIVKPEFDGDVCSTGFCVLRADTDIVTPNWLYHNISSTIFYEHVERYQKGASYPAISDAEVKMFRIPVPPIEVQREIVRILDNFTKRTAELIAELTAEFAARQKQYEYYAQRILEDAKSVSPLVSIADLGNWSGGKTPSMAEKRFWTDGTIPWISSKDMKESILSDTEDHIAECAISEASMKLYPKECIAVVTRSGILKHTFPIAFVPFETTVNQDIKMLVPAHNVLPKYAFFAMKAYSEDIRTKCKKQGGTVDSLEFQKVLEYSVPLPSMELQCQIVEILDRLEQLSSELSSGLPAEIDARQKQYEYYRDKLMTFKQLA